MHSVRLWQYLAFLCLVVGHASSDTCSTWITPEYCSRDLSIEKATYGENRHYTAKFYVGLRNRAVNAVVSFAAPIPYNTTGPRGSYQLPHPAIYIAPSNHEHINTLHLSPSTYHQRMAISSRGKTKLMRFQITNFISSVVPWSAHMTDGPRIIGSLHVDRRSLLWETYALMEISPNRIDFYQVAERPLSNQIGWIDASNAVRLRCDTYGYHRNGSGAREMGKYVDACVVHGTSTAINEVHEDRQYHVVVDPESQHSYLPSSLYFLLYDHNRKPHHKGVGGAPGEIPLDIPDSTGTLYLSHGTMPFYLNLNSHEIVLGMDTLVQYSHIAYDHAEETYYIRGDFTTASNELGGLRLMNSVVLWLLTPIILAWMTSPRYAMLKVALGNPTALVTNKLETGFEVAVLILSAITMSIGYVILPQGYTYIFVATAAFVVFHIMVSLLALMRVVTIEERSARIKTVITRTYAHSMVILGTVIIVLLPSANKFIALVVIGIFSAVTLYFIVFYLLCLMFASAEITAGPLYATERWKVYLTLESVVSLAYVLFIIPNILRSVLDAANSNYSINTVLVATFAIIGLVVILALYFVNAEVRSEAKNLLFPSKEKKS